MLAGAFCGCVVVGSCEVFPGLQIGLLLWYLAKAAAVLVSNFQVLCPEALSSIWAWCMFFRASLRGPQLLCPFGADLFALGALGGTFRRHLQVGVL